MKWGGRTLTRVAPFFGSIAAVIAWASATNAAVVTGRVVSERGEGLHAEVQLICNDVLSLAMSSQSGEFTVTTTASLDGGGCRLQVSAPGHRISVISINGPLGLNHVVRLEPSVVEEVTVVGNRIARRFATQYIASLEALARPSARGDPLRAVAGSQYSTDVGESTIPRLRGNPRAAFAVFLDDVPLNEATRGIDFQSWSTSAPSLNVGLGYDTEIYASNPPVFLPNPRASAVRFVPPGLRASQSSITLMTTGLSGLHSVDLGSTQVEASASWSDMAAMLRLNPSLDRALEESRMVAGSVRITGDGALGRIGALVLVDDERGTYPISIFSSRGLWQDSRRRILGMVGLKRRIGGAAIGVRLATMRSSGDGKYLSWDYQSTNRYHFLSCDVSGSTLGRRLAYRIGFDSEAMSLVHSGILHRYDYLFGADFPTGSWTTRDRGHTHGGAFAYATWDAVDGVVYLAGIRRHIGAITGGKESWQAGVTWEDRKRNGQGTFVLGEYQGFTVPAPSDWRAPVALEIRQAAVDYTTSLKSADIGAGVFFTRLRSITSALDIYGADVSGRWHLGDDLTGRLSVARSRRSAQSGRSHGKEDIEYVLRAGLDAQVGSTTVVGEFVRGSGLLSPEVIGSEVSAVDNSVHLPVFGKTVRLGTYSRLDVSVTVPARIGRADAIGLVAFSNVLDRRIPRVRVYSADFATSADVYFPGRVFLAGVILLI